MSGHRYKRRKQKSGEYLTAMPIYEVDETRSFCELLDKQHEQLRKLETLVSEFRGILIALIGLVGFLLIVGLIFGLAR